MTQFHFIAGLPRSGSTLLSAILRQNPKIEAGISSPVYVVFSNLLKSMNGNEGSLFISDKYKERMLRYSITVQYSNLKKSIIFDTNRAWTSKLALLARLFPECKILCCVRSIAWVMDSFERLIQNSPFDLSGIFNYDSEGTVYSRCNQLSNGLVGNSLSSLKDGFYWESNRIEGNEYSKRMLLIEYDCLTKAPKTSMQRIYEWMGLEYFEHDFENINQIPLAKEFDRYKIGTVGLHSVGKRVEFRERKTILPPELFNSFPPPFWKSDNPKIPVVSLD